MQQQRSGNFGRNRPILDKMGAGTSSAEHEFLPPDTMHKRGLCRHAVSVRLSVRLFVCHVRWGHTLRGR